jgi:CRISPR-associated protein Cmr3
MSLLTWRFTAFDSWFFRESRPFDSIGSSELGSVFPPSPATMAGAIRSAIGEHLGIDWQKYKDFLEDKIDAQDINWQKYFDLQKQIGDSNSLGNLRLKGIFPSRKNPENGGWERLYPVPADLVATKEHAKITAVYFLQAGKPVHCDLGKNVCLAVAPVEGVKPLDGYWLTQAGLTKVLNGLLPDIEKELIPASELFTYETRLGIARNNQYRAAEQGMLYQTQHIRPKPSLAIEVDVEGLENLRGLNAAIPLENGRSLKSGIVRLGGEGRGAYFEIADENNSLPKTEHSDADVLGIKLVLLSAVSVPQLNGYTPLPGFKKIEQEGETVWQGQINGIGLTLHCAMTGKVLREGGWDLQNHQPRPVRSLMPAGSVFYCKVKGDIITALKKLQTGQIGSENENSLDIQLGRGLLAVGPWFKHDNSK